ncbi:MAG: DUF2339 domain-containing protein, partial [Planctomycetota bacterium]
MTEFEEPKSFKEVLRELRVVRGRLEDLAGAVQQLQASAAAAPARAAPEKSAADTFLDELCSAPSAPAPIQTPPPLPPAVPSPSPSLSSVASPVPPRSPLMSVANRQVPPPAAPPVIELDIESLLPPIPMPPAPKKPTPDRGISLEQVIGTRWMLIAGVAVVLLGGGFFFKYAYDMGWIKPPLRVVTGALFGLVALGLGEWAFRRKMAPLAAGLFGIGVVFWYYVSWAASPNGPVTYRPFLMLSREWAFAAMCATSAIGLGLSIRSNFILAALTAVIGAMVTPYLLRSGQNAQVFLLSYLLVVNAAFLAVAIWKRWDALAPVLALGTIFLFAGWFGRYYDTDPTPALTTAYGWVFLALHAVYILVGFARREWTVGGVPAGVLGIAIVAILALAAGVCDDTAFCHLFAVQVLVLIGLLLTLAIRLKGPRAGPWLFAGATIVLAVWLGNHWVDWLKTPACVYGWVLVALATAGLPVGLLPAWRRAYGVQLLIAPLLLVGVLLFCAGDHLLTTTAVQGQLLLLTALYLALTGAMNARWLALPAIAWTVLGLGFETAALDVWLMWMWIHMGLFTLDVVRRPDGADRQWNIAQVAITGSLVVVAVLSRAESLSIDHMLAHALALEAVVLALALWRRWEAIRLLVLLWAVHLVALSLLANQQAPAQTAWWLWAMFALLAADIQARTWRRILHGDETQDAILAGFSMAAMYGGTLYLLRTHWAWMGLYSTVWAIVAIATAWLVWRFRGRTRLAYSFLAQGLILLILAVPIQFKGMWVPYFWAL